MNSKDTNPNISEQKSRKPLDDAGKDATATKPDNVERGGEVHADTPDKWSEDDKARQEQGLPKRPVN